MPRKVPRAAGSGTSASAAGTSFPSAPDTSRSGLLVIGGTGPSPLLLKECARSARFVVAADSGLDSCVAAGVVPDLVVGDMDSLSDPSLLNGFAADRILLFPRDKDETDTEIGLRTLHERGWAAVTIAGGAGGRIDHLLGVAGLFERDRPPVRWITGSEDLTLVSGEAEFLGWAGSTVSVFPVGDRAAGLHSEGLKWPLDGLELRRGFCGISNVAETDRILVRVGFGKLLVVHSFKWT
jgi:thiamine pyrophosphokinase